MRAMSKAAVVAAGATVFVFIGGAGAVTAMNPGPPADDAEPSLTGDALDRAAEAALAVTGDGYVSDTEVDDEDSYYEVEVTLPDGGHVDVQLDPSFAVVGELPDVEAGAGG